MCFYFNTMMLGEKGKASQSGAQPGRLMDLVQIPTGRGIAPIP